jgi:hypothetical protein
MRAVVDPDGTIRAVYSDKIKNMNLGKLQVTRASNVEFNEAKQLWEATTPGGELIASGPDRDLVIQEEIKIIESRL